MAKEAWPGQLPSRNWWGSSSPNLVLQDAGFPNLAEDGVPFRTSYTHAGLKRLPVRRVIAIRVWDWGGSGQAEDHRRWGSPWDTCAGLLRARRGTSTLTRQHQAR